MAITLEKFEKLQKIHRAFEAKTILTIKDLNNILRMSRKSIYNYLDDLEIEFDAVLRKDNKGRYSYIKKPNNKINLSIDNNEPSDIITKDEYDSLKMSFDVIRNFKSIPYANSLHSLIYKIEKWLDIDDNADSEIIITEFNHRYKGYQFFNTIYDAVKAKSVLEIKYEPFELNASHATDDSFLYGYDVEKNIYTWRVSPWILKEYNNRWQVIGFSSNFKKLQEKSTHEASDGIVQISLDRIINVKVLSDSKYRVQPQNFRNEFDYVVGFKRGKKEKVEVWFNKVNLQYVKSKPIHWTQQLIKEDRDGGVVSFEVVVNHEFKQELRKYLPGVDLLSPTGFDLMN